MAATVEWSEQRSRLVLDGLFEVAIPFTIEVRYRGPDGTDHVVRPDNARVAADGWRFEGEHLVIELEVRPEEHGVRLDWTIEVRADLQLSQVLPARFGSWLYSTLWLIHQAFGGMSVGDKSIDPAASKHPADRIALPASTGHTDCPVHLSQLLWAHRYHTIVEEGLDWITIRIEET